MSIAALMVTAGIFLLMAGIRDESVPSIIADVIKGGSTTGAGEGPAPSPAPAPLSPAAYQLGPGQAGPVLPAP